MPLTRNQSNAASQAKLSAANTAETSTSKDSTDQGGTSVASEPPRRDSPENCSICLGPFNNKSFTSSCAHSFCFVCLKQWSKVKAECPLCKQPFTSIFYNIRSNQQYDIYELPHQPSNQIDYNIFNYVGGALPTFPAPTHHLFSLSQPAFDADLTLSNFSRFQFRHRRYDRYLNPLNVHGEHPYSFSGPAINPSAHISAATWPRGAEDFRREVYRRNIGPPAVILGCENSTYRLTPAMVAASAHRIHRIMPWLTRELRVLLRSHQNVRHAISVIQPLLTQVSIDSIFFNDKVVPLIGHRSRHFIQEFVAFANSALSMQAYDRKAMYRRREIVPAVPSSSSSTSSENDVVEVTDISPDVYPSSASAAPGPSQTQPLNLSRSGWDSPTPGPSWDNINTQASIIDRVSVSSESDDPVYRPDLRDSDSDESKAGSDIIFVKYDKPWNERSPIKLTSESEGGEASEAARKKKKVKHKKKKKEVADNEEASGSKKDKNKKSSKSKHKDKSKSSTKALSDEEKESSGINKRHHSLSSTEHHKAKKHKKSKSKKEKLSDREIVDRYFAQAMAPEDANSIALEDQEVGVASKSKDKEKSSSKEKSKKKKKNRKRSRDSNNQSHKHTYKKHHSGHKKSSNRYTEGILTRSPIRQNQVGGPPRSDPMENDQFEASSSTVSHSLVQGIQPPYLGMTDTVQHIPVNLWVSAWPTLSVSHTYPPPPPIPMGQNIPQSSNTSSSTMTSNTNGAGHSRPALDRLSISSDSSSDSTNSESDDAQDLQIPSLQNVHTRTKQWLETNFPDLGRPQASAPTSSTGSSSTNENANASIAATKSHGPSSSQNPPDESHKNVENDTFNKENEEDIEVVSINSGEEDVVVCSSDDSCSNAGDLWVIDVDDANKSSNNLTKPSGSNQRDNPSSACNITTLPFSRNGNKPPESKTQPSTPSNIILPPTNSSFQPFKLQKKPAMVISGKDPFFPPMTHSSDEDASVSGASFPEELLSTMLSKCAGVPTNKTNELSIDNLENVISSSLTLPPVTSLTTEHGLLDRTESLNDRRMDQPQDTQILISTNTATASLSTVTSSMFSTLAPLTSSSHSNKSVLSSGISYLPYSDISPSPATSSHYIQQLSMPSPPSPASISLYPFSLLTSTTQSSSTSILPSLYSSQNQTQSSPQAKLPDNWKVRETAGSQSQGVYFASTIINSGQSSEIGSMEIDDITEEPRLLVSSDIPRNENDTRSNSEIFPQNLENVKQCDSTSSLTQVCSNGKYVFSTQPHSGKHRNCENSVPFEIADNHKKGEKRHEESSFPENCKISNDTMESATSYNPNSLLNPSYSCIIKDSVENVDFSVSVGNKASSSAVSNTSQSQHEANDKPFDALESLSFDVLEPIFVSHSTPAGTSVVTTVSNVCEQSGVLNTMPAEPGSQQSFVASTATSATPQTVSCLPKETETISHAVCNMYKPYSVGENQTLIQFSDALTSSDVSSSNTSSDSDE